MTVEELISKPESILVKAPFYRGCNEIDLAIDSSPSYVGIEMTASLPKRKSIVVSQDKFLQELDPQCHAVHFDDTIPDIAVKNSKNGSWIRQVGVRVGFNYQEIIKNKRTQYLCAKPMKFTLCNIDPAEDVSQLFVSLKQEWVNKNMDVWKFRLASSQLSSGDGAILHYFKMVGGAKKLSHRLLSYADGYCLCPHYDDNNDMQLFGVYYKTGDTERLDAYDNIYIYRYELGGTDGTWTLTEKTKHGFLEIPVTYKRGDVAWNSVQNTIDVYEVLYNVYSIVLKKFGSSVLWIKGNYDRTAKKQGWAVILNSSSLDANADAKVLTPAEPTGMQNLLADMRKQIQMGSSTILLQPEDIKVSGDVTGIAVKMMLSSAYEKAMQEALEYDDVADNMLRLFLYGIGIENEKSVQYNQLKVRAEFEAWMPQSDTEIINNINMSLSSGSLTEETAHELHPYSAPDEKNRAAEQEAKEAAKEAERQAALKSQTDNTI